MKVFFNNDYIEESEITISINNRGLNYGDGVFETIMANNQIIRFLEDHIQRLKNALAIIKLSEPDFLSVSGLSTIISQLRTLNQIQDLTRIKIQIWRKSGGLFSPTSNESEILITAFDGHFNLSPRTSVAIYDEFRLSHSPISHFKKLSSLQYVMGGIFKNEKKVDDIVFMDIEGNIAESLASNIFWAKHNILYTPSLHTGCIDGIMRKQIRLFCKNKGIEFNEGKFQLSELLNADMVFVSNVTGINAVQKIETTTYNSEPIWFKELQQNLLKI